MADAYRAGRRDSGAMREVMASLDAPDLLSVAAYYAAAPPAPQRPAPTVTGDPAGKWVPRCDRCHGDGARSSAGVAPVLDGQPAPYLRKALRDYQEFWERGNSMMHAMTELLSRDDIRTLAAHYAARPGAEPR